jgi:D-tyrosyl-tRNA(Tyr) deacylase
LHGRSFDEAGLKQVPQAGETAIAGHENPPPVDPVEQVGAANRSQRREPDGMPVARRPAYVTSGSCRLPRMRAVVQRVSEAAVTIDGATVGRIGPGLLVLVGVEQGDAADDADWLAAKIAALRIFADDDGKMNRCVREIGGETLVVSQFTLLAETARGNRPSFVRAARPEEAVPLYERFTMALGAAVGRPPERGVFAADMRVALVNDGPVTIWIDSRRRE